MKSFFENRSVLKITGAASCFGDQYYQENYAAPANAPADVAWLAIAFSVAIGVVFGMYSASKASKLKPIDALHYEG